MLIVLLGGGTIQVWAVSLMFWSSLLDSLCGRCELVGMRAGRMERAKVRKIRKISLRKGQMKSKGMSQVLERSVSFVNSYSMLSLEPDRWSSGLG
jgi:hypothetical protein